MAVGIVEATIYKVFRIINEWINTIERLTAGQLRILEEECAVRGSLVMKDGEKMKTPDENGICCNELGKKRSRGGTVQRKTVSAHCMKKGKNATEQLNVLALV